MKERESLDRDGNVNQNEQEEDNQNDKSKAQLIQILNDDLNNKLNELSMIKELLVMPH